MRLLAVLCVFFAVNAVASDRHLVLFNGNGGPADFASQVAALGGTVVYQHPVLAVVSGLSDSAAATLGKRSGIADVEADAEVSLDVNSTQADASEQDFSDATSVANPSLASFYSRQWHLRAIGAHTAWAAGRLGSPSVRVAILDTGIDRRSSPHADLAGHVDYASGAQFQLDDPTCIPAGFTYGATDDLMFHGTHVAATVSSNAVAAAGVTSKVTLIPVKVLGLAKDANGQCTGGSGSFSSVMSGVLYAADIDADVANMSLGGGFTKNGNGRFVGIINKVFNYAHSKGLLVVVAAGNSGLDLDHDGNLESTYCSTPNVVCVSALGPTVATTGLVFQNVDSPASYTNYGRSAISVAAPGGTGSSSRPRGYVTEACSRSAVSVGLAVCGTGTFVVGSNGTSMATPHVTGLAALLVENVGRNNPAQLKAALQQSADDLGQPGTDAIYGKGRINVPRALGLQ
ncbi:MAG TPA: S8 family serine peptidase [Thermoanaerobaculia bacterium]